MSEGISTSEISVQTQNQSDVEALVQAAVSVLTNDMQIATHDQNTIQTSQHSVQLLVDTCSSNNIQERLYMCTDCNLAFYGEQGEQDWQWHLRQHKPFKCDLCSESFEQKDSLKTHMRTHTMQMPFICEKCGSAYSLKSNLKQHMKTHEEKSFQCQECQVTFKTESDLNKHMKFHTGETISVYQCEECNKTFAHQKNLVQHLKIHQGVAKQYKCPECPASYSYKCHLTRHLMIHTGDKPYKCKFCGKAFNRNAHLVRHRKIHSGGEKEWKCQQCGFAFWERSDLVRHIKSHEGNRPYKCDHCDQTFVWKRYLYKHLKSSHSAPDKHFCPDCFKCFGSEEDLQMHQASDHPQKKALTHTCDVCQQEFHFKYKLDEHMYQHTGRKAHECDKCSQKFISRRELDRHKYEHTQEVSFSCNTCEKSFSTVDELQKHLRIHTGGGKFACPVCSSSFRWKSQLTNHMVVHSTDHDYICSICSKEFKRKRDLTRHVKIFHDTKPPYTCTECQLDFHSPNNLHDHKTETHWKKQDELDNFYACNRCSGMFKIKSDLEKHQLKVHPPRPYFCVLCSKRFTMLKFLEKHFELKHEEEEMKEGINYQIRPQKEAIQLNQFSVNVQVNNGDDVGQELEEGGQVIQQGQMLPNGVEEMEMVIEGQNADDKEVKQDHVYIDAAEQDHVYVDSSGDRMMLEHLDGTQENVVVVENLEEVDQGIAVSSVEHQAPMSEAITLAQFSQQVAGGTVIPVFLNENDQGQQTITLKKTSKPQQIVLGSLADLTSQSKPVSSNVAKIPQIVKIEKPVSQLSTSPRPQVIYKYLKNTGSVIQQQESSAKSGMSQIKIVPISSTAVAQQFTELTPVKQEQKQQVTIVHVSDKNMGSLELSGVENIVTEGMQTEQTDVL